jgi:hypothetical protein
MVVFACTTEHNPVHYIELRPPFIEPAYANVCAIESEVDVRKKLGCHSEFAFREATPSYRHMGPESAGDIQQERGAELFPKGSHMLRGIVVQAQEEGSVVEKNVCMIKANSERMPPRAHGANRRPQLPHYLLRGPNCE